mgnify:CR=1 FL=1
MSKLIINDRIQIPFDELHMSSSRSSGPGGQNVNKVNTKVTLHWNVAESTALPEDVQKRLMRVAANRVSKTGYLIVTSQRYRTRQRNYDDCLHKLRVMILDVAKPPKRRKATRPTLNSQLKRRRDKRRKSDKKKLRQLPNFDD